MKFQATLKLKIIFFSAAILTSFGLAKICHAATINVVSQIDGSPSCDNGTNHNGVESTELSPAQPFVTGDWVKGAGWSVSGGNIFYSGSSNTTIYPVTAPSYTIGTGYKYYIWITAIVTSNNTFTTSFGGQAGPVLTYNGGSSQTYGSYTTPTTTGTFTITSPSGAAGITITAMSIKLVRDDVDQAVASASAGDTISIGAGSCTWSWGIYPNINKGITLQGAGENSTIITTNGTRAITIAAAGSGNYRITGLGFSGTGDGTELMLFTGNWNILRMDHCTFNLSSYIHNSVMLGTGFEFTASPRALFDHITFNSPGSTNQFIKIWGSNRTSWQEDDNFGIDKAIYIEDSSFNCAPGISGSISDTEGGARMVIRHNTITNCGIYMHDTGSTQGMRGNRLVEIYNNDFSGCAGGGNCNDLVGIALRGGTGVIYNNRIGSGFWLRMRQQTFGPQGIRWSRDPLGDMGVCDATPDTICSTFAGHCLSSGQACFGSWDCNDCTWHCTTNAECNPGGSGSAVCLSQFDGQQGDSSDPGWPCRDQNGRGKDDPVTHMNTSSPIYVWNNKDENGNLIALPPDPNYPNYTLEGRDYCNHSPALSPNPQNPGTCNGIALNYTPYIYPHPLQGFSDTIPPAAPSGLAVR